MYPKRSAVWMAVEGGAASGSLSSLPHPAKASNAIARHKRHAIRNDDTPAIGYTFVDVDSLEGEGPQGGIVRIDGEEIELRPGRFIRVDPGSTRVPIAGDKGLEFVTFGAPLEGRYEPPDWG